MLKNLCQHQSAALQIQPQQAIKAGQGSVHAHKRAELTSPREAFRWSCRNATGSEWAGFLQLMTCSYETMSSAHTFAESAFSQWQSRSSSQRGLIASCAKNHSCHSIAHIPSSRQYKQMGVGMTETKASSQFETPRSKSSRLPSKYFSSDTSSSRPGSLQLAHILLTARSDPSCSC